MVVGWPGIGNVGIIAVNTLRVQIGAEELGEIEPWDFFYPRKVIIEDGILQALEFPSNRFYYKRLEKKDLLLFVGEEQPAPGGGMYTPGRKAYEMANLVLDIAERFGCHRVYTSGAAFALTHHALKPRVCAVATSETLLEEVKEYENTVLTSEIRNKRGDGWSHE